MNDQQTAQMGEYAKQVLANPAFLEAMKRLHEVAHAAFRQTNVRDAEGLKLARQFAGVTEDFEVILRRMVEGGKLAQLNLDKHRDEPAIKRAARRFTR